MSQWTEIASLSWYHTDKLDKDELASEASKAEARARSVAACFRREPGNGARLWGTDQMKKRLIFVHVPKCGGTYVREALKRLVPEASLVIKREFASSDARDRRGHFVVASVRDPCSYYASLYEYGTQNEGAFRHQLERVRPDVVTTSALGRSDAVVPEASFLVRFTQARA